MATFRKYKWNTKAEFEAFFTLSQPDATCVELGEIDNTYCVDLLWDDQPAPDWEQFEVWPEPVGVHTFLGWDEQYTKDYNERFSNSIGINIGLTIAGFLGSLLLLPKQRNWKLQLVSVFSGSLCATYLAPVLIGFLNINAPNIQYGLAFLVGFSGVKIAEVLEAKILKTLTNDNNA